MAITLDGTNGINSSGVIVAPDGSASAPAITNDGDTNTGIFFPAADTIAFAEGGAEAMRIDSSGNVGIGTSSPASTQSGLDVSSGGLGLVLGAVNNSSARTNSTAKIGRFGVYHYTNTEEPMTIFNAESDSTNNTIEIGGGSSILNAATVITFRTAANNTTTNGTERMRIDSSGRLLVGTTSASTPTGSTSKIVSQGDFSVGGEGFGMSIASTAGTGEDHYYISFQTATTTQRGYIYYNNGAGQVQLSATSDIRLKENIVNAPLSLPILKQVKVRQYDWKETGNTNVGFIAQELYDVIPRAVSVGEDNEDGSIKRVWGVDNGTLVPYLVKAIQELSAKNDALEARIAALEGAQA